MNHAATRRCCVVKQRRVDRKIGGADAADSCPGLGTGSRLRRRASRDGGNASTNGRSRPGLARRRLLQALLALLLVVNLLALLLFLVYLRRWRRRLAASTRRRW